MRSPLAPRERDVSGGFRSGKRSVWREPARPDDRFLKPNRLRSAFATLALEPEAARRTLQTISDRDEYPQAADARGMMRALDDGSYVPS